MQPYHEGLGPKLQKELQNLRDHVRDHQDRALKDGACVSVLTMDLFGP